MATDDGSDIVSRLERVIDNPTARRELLWLRAKEKQDEASARSLEKVEPGLATRMRALVEAFDIENGQPRTPREQRERFGRLFDDLFAGRIRP